MRSQIRHGPVILLGKAPGVDWSLWDRYCQAKLGKVLPQGAKVTPEEWIKLGYTAARDNVTLKV